MTPIATPDHAAAAFIDHALGLEWAMIPPAAGRAARLFLRASIAVGVAGVNAPHADDIVTAAARWGDGRTTVLGRAEMRLPAPHAAFVNAFQIQHRSAYSPNRTVIQPCFFG